MNLVSRNKRYFIFLLVFLVTLLIGVSMVQATDNNTSLDVSSSNHTLNCIDNTAKENILYANNNTQPGDNLRS